jgi:hypothetical protein
MRTTTMLTGTVLTAACLFGVTGLSSVANAAEPTAGTAVAASDANLKASRHVELRNSTGETFTVQKVFFVTDGRTSGSLPEDSFPAVGTQLRPGQSLGLEVHAWADHAVNVILVDSSGHLVIAYLLVSGGTTYPSGQNIGAGGAVYTFTPQPSIGLLTIGTPAS